MFGKKQKPPTSCSSAPPRLHPGAAADVQYAGTIWSFLSPATAAWPHQAGPACPLNWHFFANESFSWEKHKTFLLDHNLSLLALMVCSWCEGWADSDNVKHSHVSWTKETTLWRHIFQLWSKSFCKTCSVQKEDKREIWAYGSSEQSLPESRDSSLCSRLGGKEAEAESVKPACFSNEHLKQAHVQTVCGIINCTNKDWLANTL